MSVQTYNPKKVTCSLGNHMVTGYAEDSMITVEYAGDGTNVVSGADGEVVRSIDPSELYNVTITVQQTSPTNAFLQKKYEQDRANGNGMFPVNIVDVLGNEKFAAQTAWVAKPATFTRGRTNNNRQWSIVAYGGSFN